MNQPLIFNSTLNGQNHDFNNLSLLTNQSNRIAFHRLEKRPACGTKSAAVMSEFMDPSHGTNITRAIKKVLGLEILLVRVTHACRFIKPLHALFRRSSYIGILATVF